MSGKATMLFGILLVACGPTRPESPHLFLITADTLRADHTSLAGYERDTTPNLAALAEDAHHFTQAVTLIPKTGPSFATHWTGRPPAEHRVTSNRFGVPSELPVLAELLAEHGYETAAFVSNPVLSRSKGFDRGFSRYEEFSKQGGLDDLNAAFLLWADGHSWDRPTFVWIHYIDPHGPYTPPSRYRNRYIGDALFERDDRIVPLDYQVPEGRPRNQVLGAVPAYQRMGDEARAAWYVSQYDAEIRYMDDSLGIVLDFLRRRSLYDQSGIVFTSDHGESLGEHDYYFEHGWFVYDATLRVPLVIKPPGGSEPRTSHAQVSNLDTLPTLSAMTGARLPPALPGRDVLSSDAAKSVLVQSPSLYPPRLHGVRTPEIKFVVDDDTGAEELYQLSTDPGEERDLVEERPELAVRLRAELRRLRSGVQGRAADPSPVELGDEERELLERLGYVEP